jgi:cell division septation protein DedD
MGEPQDTEITLGTGKLLALFFVLVAVCAVFFGLGYSAGKSSVKPSEVVVASTTQIAHAAEAKPSANPSTPSSPAPQKAADAKDSDSQSEATSTAAQAAAPDATEKPKQSADPMVPPVLNGYYVQVAAVREQGDADALVDALKKKQYAASSTAEADKLFHVQIGPFSELKDAEAIRIKLISDGYSPIVKK